MASFSSRINSRQQLIDYALAKLGSPVNNISVTPEQCEYAVDEAIDMFWEYHADGCERKIFAVQINQDMLDGQYVQLPKNVLSVLRVLPGSAGDFLNPYVNLQYQMYITDLMDIRNFNATGVSGYVIAESYLNLLGDILSPEPVIEFNKHTQHLGVEMDWSRVILNDFVLVECYITLDLDANTEAYNNKWLKDYTIQLIKKQYGANISKYDTVILPGGVKVRGAEIYEEAQEAITVLEQRLRDEYQLPVDFFVG